MNWKPMVVGWNGCNVISFVPVFWLQQKKIEAFQGMLKIICFFNSMKLTTTGEMDWNRIVSQLRWRMSVVLFFKPIKLLVVSDFPDT